MMDEITIEDKYQIQKDLKWEQFKAWAGERMNFIQHHGHDHAFLLINNRIGAQVIFYRANGQWHSKREYPVLQGKGTVIDCHVTYLSQFEAIQSMYDFAPMAHPHVWFMRQQTNNGRFDTILTEPFNKVANHEQNP